MKFVALLRGINVGGQHKVEMKRLSILFEKLDCVDVETYINSGNVLFASQRPLSWLKVNVAAGLIAEFGFSIPVLLKTEREIKSIAAAIPDDWLNDSNQRTDVAYLFPEIDSKKIINNLPFRAGLARVIYTKGALIWNIDRVNVIRSGLSKLIGQSEYKLMTIRNVNTARFLAGSKR